MRLIKTLNILSMKKTILLNVLCFAFFLTNAQISLTPEVSEGVFLNQDLSDNDLDLEVTFHVTNTTDEMLSIKWLREIEEDCPGWETQICDNVTCYFSHISSNITLPDLNVPMVLNRQETFDDFILHIKPRQNAGCCQVKVHFSLIDDPDNIITTATINARVNVEENCVVSVEDAAEITSIKVFPNPTSDFFKLTTTDLVSTVLLKNTLGQELRNYNFEADGQYVVSNLPSGFYFIQMLDDEGATLKLLPLTINAN